MRLAITAAESVRSFAFTYSEMNCLTSTIRQPKNRYHPNHEGPTGRSYRWALYLCDYGVDTLQLPFEVVWLIHFEQTDITTSSQVVQEPAQGLGWQ